jgi:hypothetical protein
MEFLPDEIRENIFKKLNADDLMSVMLVDKYTKSLIESSPKLMEKLQLFIYDEDEYFDDIDTEKRCIEPLLSCSRRKITKVTVKLKCDKIMKYFPVFKKFSDHIRILTIDKYAFDTIDQMRIILRCLINLKVLNVTSVTFLKAENKILNSIVQSPRLFLKELREINCVDSHIIFKLFTNNCEVKLRKISLTITDISNQPQTYNYRAINYVDVCELLIQQNELISLSIYGINSNYCDIFAYENSLYCQLRHLELINCVLSRDHMRNVIKMIKHQKYLDKIKFINTTIPAEMDIIHVYRQIFFNAIRQVHIDIYQLAFVSHRFNFVNCTVEDLTIYGNFAFENLPIFRNFIKIFPNVLKLKIMGAISDKYLHHILSSFKSLIELNVTGIKCNSRPIASNFSPHNDSGSDVKLKTLIVDYIDVKFFAWKNMLNSMRSIDKLIIKRDSCSIETIDVIIKTLKLRHLELGCVSEDILDNIINNCSELRVLKIRRADFEKINKKIDFHHAFARNRLLLYLCDENYFQDIF